VHRWQLVSPDSARSGFKGDDSLPTVRVSDIDLYYEISGEGEPVLLIHGLGGSSRDWDRQIAALRLTYQVIAVDLRGHGKSDKPFGSYTIAQFGTDTPQVLPELVERAARLVGIPDQRFARGGPQLELEPQA
jgi:pimeloyl-ACP methyl ester carboxylesterase